MGFLTNLSISSFLLISLFFTFIHATTFNIQNNCPFTVWAAAVPGGGGKQLNQHQSWNLNVNTAGSSGVHIWARTKCTFNEAGLGQCETGDCSGLLQCQIDGLPPFTQAEFTTGSVDILDISLLQGFNVPVEFSPTSNGCTRGPRCTSDINGQCPTKLRAKGGCQNPCTVFNTNQYCCASRKAQCGPTNYSRFFKDKCPMLSLTRMMKQAHLGAQVEPSIRLCFAHEPVFPSVQSLVLWK